MGSEAGTEVIREEEAGMFRSVVEEEAVDGPLGADENVTSRSGWVSSVSLAGRWETSSLRPNSCARFLAIFYPESTSLQRFCHDP